MTDSTRRAPAASQLPSALDPERSEAWMSQVRQGGTVFLDYDGTLTPIVERPEQARLSDAMRERVRRLVRCCPVTVVTGRDTRVIQELVAIESVGYVGSHGLEIVGPPGSGLSLVVADGYLAELDAAESALHRETRGVAGVIIERKRFTIATHVRQVDADRRPEVESAVERVRAAHPRLRREGGKMLYELRPDIAWDKGAAVRWLLARMERDPSRTLYIGDDLTDETAFRVLDPPATTIVVAEPGDSRLTAARFRLDDPTQVGAAIDQLLSRWGGAR